ncbi:NUDIX domain-containing protein [Sphingomonas sp. CJ20]
MAETVGAILVSGERVLLGLRAAHKSFAGTWDIIGGHIEDGESPWPALCRELMEELGIECAAGDYLDTLVLAQSETPSVVHIYAVSSWLGEPTVRDDEHSEIRWFPFESAALLPNRASPQYRTIFSQLGRRFCKAPGS